MHPLSAVVAANGKRFAAGERPGAPLSGAGLSVRRRHGRLGIFKEILRPVKLATESA